jgi:hypothetical protein
MPKYQLISATKENKLAKELAGTGLRRIALMLKLARRLSEIIKHGKEMVKARGRR